MKMLPVFIMQRYDIKDILERVNIKEVITKYEKLQDGKSRYIRGVEHDSLVVDTGKQRFFWNKKGIAGNSLDFLIKVVGKGFHEAMEELCLMAGEEVKNQYPFAEAEMWSAAPDYVLRYWHTLLFRTGRQAYFQKRGISKLTMEKELLGWDGFRYVIPTWEAEPQESQVYNVALRASELCDLSSPKYISLKGYARPVIAGSWECRGSDMVLGFAGTFDRLLAMQDGYPAFTVVPGQNALQSADFPKDWPISHFPDAKMLILPWDKGETQTAAMLCKQWHDHKGYMDGRPTAHVLWWPADEVVGDYCDYRVLHSAQEFHQNILLTQLRLKTGDFYDRYK
ncbi:MAG: hypothetical protein OEX12_06110 [Gammaproteobacteria bacterium]|nr:hypothetical protein [Gammaproteobacteria bacterium]